MNSLSRRLQAVLFAGFLALGASLGAAVPAHAADPKPSYATLHLCDPTGCYFAWKVVDSDGDGFCDADELMAGTNPHDAKSHPLLTVVVQLAVDRKLPSFEAGLGAFLAVPQQILDARAEAGIDVLGAFDMGSRRSTIEHLGMTFGEINTKGVDLDPTHGFTLGLNGKGGKGSMPGIKVGGIDVALLSQEGASFSSSEVGSLLTVEKDQRRYTFGQEHGGVRSSKLIDDGTGTQYEFNDGTTRTSRSDGEGGAVVTTTNSDGSEGPTTVVQHQDTSTGSREKRSTFLPNGDTTNVTYVDIHEHPDGGSSAVEVSTTFVRDDDGKVIGTVVVTTATYISKDGSWGSTSQVVQSCDASGSNCTTDDAHYEDSDDPDDEEYVDPDANTDIVTFEMVDKTLRMRGAAITVVDGWTAPGFENDPANPNDPGVVSLIDSDLATGNNLLSPPRVTTAQPEGRPDLPSPSEAAPTSGGGTCGGLCS
ncbi:thrombospondin type 3 repeat-containing protein [Catellatospora tritici]|uniref:thrombospondin type 3 repeat-containing protein n=1 Tax=Catellatospora tritici TaxID=2851566 RepID=UPI001C2CE609|nr:thrombospondin type 3 repeat-containing protein [Catellatospora tritici]MBV1852594.1 thrombospondin type 3 repeat-containing protein [Catellatospora tritici]